MKLNLKMFDGEGAAGAEGASAEGAEVVYGKQEGTSLEGTKPAGEGAGEDEAAKAEKRKADFEKLIKGEYKDLYTERFKKEMDRRFKSAKQTEDALSEANSVLDILKQNYGVADIKGLKAALESDDSLISKRAAQNGLSVEQQRIFDAMQSDNRALQEFKAQQEAENERQRVLERWNTEAAAAAGIYPGLSLETEANDPETGEQFMRLLSSGVDVRTAYEVIHKDDIISGAMHYTAQKVKEKTVNDIRARGLRPQENGAQGSTAAKVVKSDPKSWTDKDMDEVIRRVAAGERIVL